MRLLQRRRVGNLSIVREQPAYADAKAVASKLIDDAGFTPFDLGGLADAAPMEAPRRPGAVYGEEYHLSEAEAFLAERTGRSEEMKR